jgi:hypothetical protein
VTDGRAPLSRAEAAALLDVPEDAPPADVQRAYLRAARRTHPDAHPEADEPARRAAAEAFDRLTLARDVLVEPAPPPPSGATPGPEWRYGPEGPAGPRYRRVEGRGLGGSLVVLALLAFLLIALVSLQQAFLAPLPGPTPAPTPTSSSTAL